MNQLLSILDHSGFRLDLANQSWKGEQMTIQGAEIVAFLTNLAIAISQNLI